MELKPCNLKTVSKTTFEVEITGRHLRDMIREVMKLPDDATIRITVDGDVKSNFETIAMIEVEAENLTNFRTSLPKPLVER